MMNRKHFFLLSLAMRPLLALAACTDTKDVPAESTYPAAYTTTSEQTNTINSLARINDEGTFYLLE